MTVIILTSGTSWTVPSDWTNTNQIETWGAGGGGGNNPPQNSGGSGGGAYSSSSNLTGLSGSISIGIGAGGGNGTTGGNGGGTWFNGSSVATGTVSSNGGTGVLNVAAGGAGGTTGGNGTTKFAGGAGGTADGTSGDGGAGGGGAAGPAGAGVAGAANSGAAGGNGGAGDNGSGGAGGAGGASGASGHAGTANSNGAGGGGGGGHSGTPGAGAGGLPGGGGGGVGTGPSSGNGGIGGGGQIRITYTPAAAGVGTQWNDSLGPQPMWSLYRQAVRAKDSDVWEYNGWTQQPRPPDTVMGYTWTDVPRGPYLAHRYQDWQHGGIASQQPAPVWWQLPQTTWTTRAHTVDFQGWVQGPRPAEYLVPLPRTEVPPGRYNWALYQDWWESPQPPGIQQKQGSVWWERPITLDPRNSYQGIQLGPQPQSTQVPAPLPVFDVPRGVWSVSAYQFHTAGFQRLEYQAPLPVSDVPRGTDKNTYVGWQAFLTPADVGPPLQSSRSYDLPMPSALTLMAGHNDLFSGWQVGTLPVEQIAPFFNTWLPLVGVGNRGP